MTNNILNAFKSGVPVKFKPMNMVEFSKLLKELKDKEQDNKEPAAKIRLC